MAKRNKRLQPRFFIFLLITVALLIAIGFLIKMIIESIADRIAGEMLALPAATEVPLDPENLLPGGSGVFDVETLPPLPTGTDYYISADADALPAKFGFTGEVRINNSTEQYNSNPRAGSLRFGQANSYTSVPGILTFGSNHYRNSFSYGNPHVSTNTISYKWEYRIGSLGEFSGTSWTGQALIVEWPPEVRAVSGIDARYKNAEKPLHEVIYPAADGNIYFMELTTGQQTRAPITVGVPLLGTGSIDPRGWPMLYVGGGMQMKNDRGNEAAYIYAVDLIQNKVVDTFVGKDYFANRDDWCAFDASPLIIDDTILFAGESGIYYTTKLNTVFDPAEGKISITQGDRIKFRYQGQGYAKTSREGARWYGFEASPTVFRNFVYLADNGGRLLCLDINTLRLQFVTDLGGDTDASPVLEEDGNNNTAYIYTVNQVQTSSSELPEGYGYASVKKIDALTGRIVWDSPQAVYVGDGKIKSGSRATPHVGRGNISDLVIVTYYQAGVVQRDGEGNESYAVGGRIVAYNKDDGAIVWSIDQNGEADYMSSPLVIYSSRGKAYLVCCDRAGYVKLYDPQYGGPPLCNPIALGARIDSTPVAFESYIIIGTTGKGGTPRIVGIKIE
ncbi:MAG: hypothetical protein FWF10_09715 [Clostridiales bacterium]|nr:hypothetical protein [Clostridiales bacterium]